MTLGNSSVAFWLSLDSSIRWVVVFMALWLASPSFSIAQQQLAIPPELQSLEKTVTIHSDSQENEGNLYRVKGNVVVTFREMRLTADEATFDNTSGEVIAKGNVTFTDPNAHFEARSEEHRAG